jgi:hypothetical protein
VTDVSLATVVAGPARDVSVRDISEGRRLTLRALVPASYLLAAFVLTARLWPDPDGRAVAGNPVDNALAAWFIRYSATAIAHGHLPALVTTALNAPRGASLMWNTALLLPGVLLSPVTLLAGPQASLTVLLTAGFAGSAASLYVVLRRWGASWTAAAIGGAVYGFSPALVSSAMAHYDLQFAVFPPLIIDALLRLLTGRGGTRTGALLGALTAAQLFTGEELLVETLVTAAILAAALTIGRTVRPAVGPLAAAAGTALALSGWALWVQFRGPLREHGIPWVENFYAARPPAFVTPSAAMLLHTAGSAASAAHYPAGRPEYLAYLGLPMLLLVIAATAGYWRDPRIRLTGSAFAILELCTLGGGSVLYPWHWLRHLPVLANLLPDRFAIIADGLAAAVLAFALDRLRTRVPAPGVAATVLIAVLPVVPLPLRATTLSPRPAGWATVVRALRLPPDRPVLIVPDAGPALTWQAQTGLPGSIIGSGDVLVPDSKGRPSTYLWQRRPTACYLAALWYGQHPRRRLTRAQLDSDLAYWRPAAIITVTSPGSALARFLDAEFGRAAAHTGAVYAWRP